MTVLRVVIINEGDKMKVSDYIVQYLIEKNCTSVFGYPGGQVTHLMDSFTKTSGIKAYINYNEQGAAFAACGYAQVSGNVGVAFATSGPGATNLITGICHAYFESVPTLFITGQVNTYESKGSLSVRQKGFQETDIVEMVKSVTKYCAYVDNPDKIKLELDKAFYYATSNRPGPVLLDIPLNIQRSDIDLENIDSFDKESSNEVNYSAVIDVILKGLKESRKPVLLVGNGVNSSSMRKELRILVDKLKIPVVSSMIAVDLFPSEIDYYYGFIGAYGIRYSNLIISKSDLIITLGSRLDCRQTGAYKEKFCEKAKLIRIDVDKDEFENRIKPDEIELYADLKTLLPMLSNNSEYWDNIDFSLWKKQCDFYRNKLLNIDTREPNKMIEKISGIIPDDSIITTDVGQNQVWVAQSFIKKSNQRIIFSGGHGAMGFSLPASIGAYYAKKKPVYCFTGDGGLQMNIQELQFISRESLPVKIMLLNNHSLGMIRHFQEMYFDSNYAFTVENKGYSAPDFEKVAKAYDIRSYKINSFYDLKNLEDTLTDPYPVLFDINIGDRTYTFPKLVYNKAISDQDPPLNERLFDELEKYED
jgi:acetolactate synthase-1/2/3 large subunit